MKDQNWNQARNRVRYMVRIRAMDGVKVRVCRRVWNRAHDRVLGRVWDRIREILK